MCVLSRLAESRQSSKLPSTPPTQSGHLPSAESQRSLGYDALNPGPGHNCRGRKSPRSNYLHRSHRKA
jgi:hypothetical protein